METRSSFQLILASGSPQRRQLLTEAGYQFVVVHPSETAECGICSRESPPEMVARLAYQKAKDVAVRTPQGIVIGCDTVAECRGQILGKPRNQQHACQMLQLLRGQEHFVHSGLCTWQRPVDKSLTQVATTRLRMKPLSDAQITDYLGSGAWQEKAGAFGLQDRLGWLEILEGSDSNVVGLPLDLLQAMLATLGE